MSNREIEQFARELNAEVLLRAAGADSADVGAGEFKVNAFTAVVTDYLTEAGIAEDIQPCYFEKALPANKGIIQANGYYLPESEDGAVSDRLDLFYALYTGGDGEHLENLTDADIKEALNRSIRLFVLAKSGNLAHFEESTDAFDMLSAIRERAPHVRKIRVFLLTDKVAKLRAQELLQKNLKSLDSSKAGNPAIRVELVDVVRLHNLVKRGGERDPITVDLTEVMPHGLPCIKAPQANPSYSSYVAVIPGALLYDLYEEYGVRLLQLNVRAFLQVRGAVNKGIRNTLVTEPSMFLPYNNGISATAEALELGKGPEGEPTIKSIRGLQVVNGGQTMASIHNAVKNDRATITDVYVQAKITVVENRRELEFDELVKKISQFSNSQNKVSLADFGSNDPFHVEIDRLSQQVFVPGERSRWFYERAKGSYQVAKARSASTPARLREFEAQRPPSQVFTKTDLAKYLATWDCLPHMVAKGSQKNFVEYMALLKQRHLKKWQPDTDFYRQLIAKAIIFRAMEKIARQEQFPAYRANVVAYTVALLAANAGPSFSTDAVWMRQGVSAELEHVLRAWARPVFETIIESAGARNVTEWCKKTECWTAVARLKLELPKGLPELSKTTVTDWAEPIDADDHAAEALEYTSLAADVTELPASAWTLIGEWGGGGHLTKDQLSLCQKFARAAENDWEKMPTLAECRKAQHVLSAVRKCSSILDMYN